MANDRQRALKTLAEHQAMLLAKFALVEAAIRKSAGSPNEFAILDAACTVEFEYLGCEAAAGLMQEIYPGPRDDVEIPGLGEREALLEKL